jgi:hypothetical protein
MNRINASMVVAGGVVAALIFFVGDAIVNGTLLKAQWSEALKVVGMSSADEAFHHPTYFAVHDLLKSLIAVWLYAAIRPRFGSGPRTAVIAGIAVWALVLPVPMIGLLPMRFLSLKFAATWSILALVPIVAGTIAGAWVYRE